MFISKEIKVDLSVEQVFKYVMNFSQLYEWDDNIIEGHRIDLGEIKVGSKFNLLYSILGTLQNLEYTLVSFNENQSLEFRCITPSFNAIDKIIFLKLDNNKTSITYSVNISVKNKIQDLVLKSIMNRIANRVIFRLKEVLEKKESFQTSTNSLSLLNIPYRFSKKGWNYNRKQFCATSMRSKTVLITGATSGLGKSTTFNLASKGCDLILVGRNHDKLEQLKNEIINRGFVKKIDIYSCEMEDLVAVDQTCNQIIAQGHRIDGLINNAGALYSSEKSINGVERTTVVDLLAPTLICSKLIKIISLEGCIINVTSGGMYSTGLNIDELKVAALPFSGAKAYALAKRALHIYSIGLNAEVEKNGIRIHSMHPGWADTPGVLGSLPIFYRLTKRWLRTPFQGSDTIVWLVMNNPNQGGKLWLDRKIQPDHILNSTTEKQDDYLNLRNFLDPFIGA